MEEKAKSASSPIIKVVLFGPESTGKSTLTKALADYYKEPCVEEYMRTYLEERIHLDQFEFTKNHLIPIAKGQLEHENQQTKRAKQILFCDTNLLQIYTYAKEYYPGYQSDFFENAIKHRTYHLYILTDIDIPWEPDPLRDKPHERKKMYKIFEKTLKKFQLPYICVSGSLEERMLLAKNKINLLIKEN